MFFEVYPKGKKWAVRHILSQNDVMGGYGNFRSEKQAYFYAAEFENSPFVWCFTDPADLWVLNNEDEVLTFVTETRAKANQVK